MGENRNRRNKRRSRNSLGNRMALIGITVVVGSLAVVVHIGGTSLRERDLNTRHGNRHSRRRWRRRRREPPNSKSTVCMSRRNSISRKSQKKNWDL